VISNEFISSKFGSREWVETWLTIANHDIEFRVASDGLNCQFLLGIGDTRHIFHLSGRGLVILGISQADDSWNFAIHAPVDTWKNLLHPFPPPGSQSLIALRTTDATFRWEGDMLLAAQSLHALNRLVEILREHNPVMGKAKKQDLMDTNAELKHVARDPSLITGHYVDLKGYDEVAARIYYEESGHGLPLVLLHTACADSRQYHELLSDIELASHWHMFAFDLPFHGRSIPPDGWWRSQYILTAEVYANWCVSFIKNVVGKRPILLGCSMGALIAVYLAAQYSTEVRAVIGFEAPDSSPARRSRFFCHPQVNQAAHNPSYAYGLMSPLSPELYRKRAWWYYSQSGYGVYGGDLHFYIDEWDGAKVASEIDTSKCPVYLFSGEYDYSAPPRSTSRLADRISGAKFSLLEGLGHFPMIENPNLFRFHLLPVLEELKSTYST